MPNPLLVAAAPAAIGGIASLFGGERANRQRRKEAQRNRDFQERMRNTSWQAAVADMTAAGINPALAYSQGGAAVPGGSMATQEDTISPAVSSALQTKRVTKELQLLDTQIAKTKHEAKGAEWNAETIKQRLQAYGVEWRNGKFHLQIPGDKSLPRMTQEIDALIGLNQNRSRREQLTGDAIVPMSELAKNLGMLLPILTGTGAIAPRILQLLKKPSKGLTIKNYRR